MKKIMIITSLILTLILNNSSIINATELNYLRKRALDLEDELMYEQDALNEMINKYSSMQNHEDIKVETGLTTMSIESERDESVSRKPMIFENPNDFPINIKMKIKFDEFKEFAPRTIIEPSRDNDFSKYNKAETQEYASLGIEMLDKQYWLKYNDDSLIMVLYPNEIIDVDILIGVGNAFDRVTNFSLIINIETMEPDSYLFSILNLEIINQKELIKGIEEELIIIQRELEYELSLDKENNNKDSESTNEDEVNKPEIEEEMEERFEEKIEDENEFEEDNLNNEENIEEVDKSLTEEEFEEVLPEEID